MQLLDAANYVLRTLGERPVSTLDMNHPTLAVVIPELDQQRKSLLLKGWWFNRRPVTLLPGPDGKFKVPDKAIAVVMGGNDLYYALDGYMYDPVQETFNIPVTKLKPIVTFDVEFQALPEVAAQVVQLQAAVSAYCHDIGMENTVQMWQQEATRAHTLLEREHLRNMKYSTRNSTAAMRVITAMRGI